VNIVFLLSLVLIFRFDSFLELQYVSCRSSPIHITSNSRTTAATTTTLERIELPSTSLHNVEWVSRFTLRCFRTDYALFSSLYCMTAWRRTELRICFTTIKVRNEPNRSSTKVQTRIETRLTKNENRSRLLSNLFTQSHTQHTTHTLSEKINRLWFWFLHYH
jgi:hypothetical protein